MGEDEQIKPLSNRRRVQIHRENNFNHNDYII